MSRIVWNSAVGALAIFLLSEPAPAATISYADAVHTLMGACQKEMVTSCKNVHIGSGRLEACLGSSGVSQSCSATFHQVQAEIAARLEAEAAMPEICKAD